MKKLKIFESGEYNTMLLFLKSDNYKQLTSLKRNIVYSYIMIESGKMTLADVAKKLDISLNLARGWVEHGIGLYSENKINPDIMFKPQNAFM